jgi:haloacetate dehalogenase
MPLLERLERTDWRFALNWWHWWFFAQLEQPAEVLINANPDAWYTATPEHMGEQAYADLRRALRDPDVVHAMLEDYRAGLREDREHDEADRAAGRRITCPLLVISLLQDDPDLDYGTDIAEIWRPWATDVRGATIDCGHHVAEEEPDALAALILDFLGDEVSKPPLTRPPHNSGQRGRPTPDQSADPCGGGCVETPATAARVGVSRRSSRSVTCRLVD